MTTNPRCDRCDGCGQIANTDDGEPWTAWTSLPAASAVAIRMGLVKPIPCPECRSKDAALSARSEGTGDTR